MNTYLVKIFLKILRGGKCGGYHEGKDRYQTVAYLSNHIIQPLSKKFNRKASICQECFSMFQISMFLEHTYHTTSMPRFTSMPRIVRNAFSTLSRTTFYKWLKIYQKDGLKGLLDRPKTPLRKRVPTMRKKYELDIIRVRNNNPTWSKEKIAIER